MEDFFKINEQEHNKQGQEWLMMKLEGQVETALWLLEGHIKMFGLYTKCGEDCRNHLA